jgi:hypothetical protein
VKRLRPPAQVCRFGNLGMGFQFRPNPDGVASLMFAAPKLAAERQRWCEF